METGVWWNAGGGSLNKEVEWRQWFGRTVWSLRVVVCTCDRCVYM